MNSLKKLCMLALFSILLLAAKCDDDNAANNDLSKNLANELASANDCNCSETTTDGDKEADGNSENSVFYYGYEFRMMVDPAVTPSQPEWYNIDKLVGDVGALTVTQNEDGSVTAIGKCFISPNSGKCYKFIGFKEKSSSNSLINQSVYKFTNSDGTQRAYWATFTSKN